MRKYDDTEHDRAKRKAKRATNRPGEGIRIRNKYAGEFDDSELEFDVRRKIGYNHRVDTDTKQ